MLAVHELVLWFKVGFENAAACKSSRLLRPLMSPCAEVPRIKGELFGCSALFPSLASSS